MRHKTSIVVRLTGFSPELLRSWERRHSLLAPERTEGGHRLYTDDDLAVLAEVRRLRAQGRSIGAIAREGRAQLLDLRRRRLSGEESSRPESPRSGFRRLLTSKELQASRADLIRAAIQVDSDRFARSVGALKDGGRPRQFVPEILAPVSVRIGELWLEGVCSVAGEHMATSLIAGCLLELLAGQVAATPADSGSRIVCAGLPGERHENPGLFWALKQTWAGHRVVWLGIDLPLDELDRACELLLPAEVHLSVTLPRTLQACRSELRDFERRWSGRAVVRVGGAGVEQAAASPA